MKKAITILLVFIHLFKLVGYQPIFSFVQLRNIQRAEACINSGVYNDSELVTIKVHYPLPYAANWGEYEKCDGNIEVNGVHYNYVKRKLANDTLYLLCIPNYEQARLSVAKNDVCKSFGESTGQSEKDRGKGEEKLVQKNLCDGYKQTQWLYRFLNTSLFISQKHSVYSQKPVKRFKQVPYQPPQYIA